MVLYCKIYNISHVHMYCAAGILYIFGLFYCSVSSMSLKIIDMVNTSITLESKKKLKRSLEWKPPFFLVPHFSFLFRGPEITLFLLLRSRAFAALPPPPLQLGRVTPQRRRRRRRRRRRHGEEGGGREGGEKIHPSGNSVIIIAHTSSPHFWKQGEVREGKLLSLPPFLFLRKILDGPSSSNCLS